VRVCLEGGDEPVEKQREAAGERERPAAALANGLPDEPGAADLEDGGDAEEPCGACDGRRVDPHR